MMGNPAIYEKLSVIFQDVFDNDIVGVTPEMAAKDVEGWDSLTHIRLMLTIEREFGVRFSASEVGKLKNVGELASLIASKTA